MLLKEAEAHFNWVGTIVNRLIWIKQIDYELPMLSLSFLANKVKYFPNYSKCQPTDFPVKLVHLKDGLFYGIIISALSSFKKSLNPASTQNTTFDKDDHFSTDLNIILRDISNQGYRPTQPCTPDGLKQGIIQHHINLCKSIEKLVLDRSLTIELLLTDIRNVPHSFYFLRPTNKITTFEFAVSLWLSKFHCNEQFKEETRIKSMEEFENEYNYYNLTSKTFYVQKDTSTFAKVAACLSRIYPKLIDKDQIKTGKSTEDIDYNRRLTLNIFNELHGYIPSDFPTDETLFYLFISDLYHATRNSMKKFVDVEQSNAPTNTKLSKLIFITNYKTAITHTQSASVLGTKPPVALPELEKPNPINEKPKSSLMLSLTKRKMQGRIMKPKVDTSNQLIKNFTTTKSHNQLYSNTNLLNIEYKSKCKMQHKHKKKRINLNQETIESSTDGQIDIQNEEIESEEEKQAKIEHELLLQQQQKNMEIMNNHFQLMSKKRTFEFPEIEILFKKAIHSDPEQQYYYINIFDTFMKTIDDAISVNSPNIGNILNFTKSAFEHLLEGRKLDYSFEDALLKMIRNKRKKS